MVPELGRLFASVRQCARCPGMGCPPVLSPANGPAGATVLVVGEAPGRFGAGRTGVPFSGDTAGRRFEALLGAAGFARERVFVTNAVLCLPLDASGRNRRPAAIETANCASWLRATIEVVNPQLVVGMGAVALASLNRIERHGLTVSHAGQPPVAWRGARLAAVYHPAARSAVHRPWDRQLADWARLGAWSRCVQVPQ
ncbi:MAG: uracil-DNA glycosylase [Dehalococcoidia bacterium]